MDDPFFVVALTWDGLGYGLGMIAMFLAGYSSGYHVCKHKVQVFCNRALKRGQRHGV